jgi:uncharacterized membrane protein
VRSLWTVPGPDGSRITCTAELTSDIPEWVVAWQVTDGPLPHEGRAEFTPHGPGTVSQIKVDLRYPWPPAAELDPEAPRRVLRQALDNLAVATRRPG